MRIVILALALTAAAYLDAGGAPPKFDENRAWEHLLAQCAFGPRNPGGSGHERCRAYLESALRATGGRVDIQRFRAKPGGSADSLWMTNLEARFGPPGRALLLGAHWDTRPWSDEDPDPKKHDLPILGANDGASGVAVLLSLAEMMAVSPPPQPVTIVLFDGEDSGTEGSAESWCLGSRAYAGRLTAPIPKAGVIVDIVGAKDLLICREEYSETVAPWLNDVVFGLAEALGLPGFQNDVCYAVYDDHIPLIERGIPTVDLVDMQYRQWHTQEDVPHACSRESLGQVGDLLVELVYGGAFQ